MRCNFDPAKGRENGIPAAPNLNLNSKRIEWRGRTCFSWCSCTFWLKRATFSSSSDLRRTLGTRTAIISSQSNVHGTRRRSNLKINKIFFFFSFQNQWIRDSRRETHGQWGHVVRLETNSNFRPEKKWMNEKERLVEKRWKSTAWSERCVWTECKRPVHLASFAAGPVTCTAASHSCDIFSNDVDRNITDAVWRTMPDLPTVPLPSLCSHRRRVRPPDALSIDLES